MKKIVLLSTAFFLVSCATKQYPQAGSLTAEETEIMTCQDVKVEIAKTKGLEKEIDDTGDFDARTVFGFLGDFGIGNGMAKSDARKKVRNRLEQLEMLKYNKCSQEENT